MAAASNHAGSGCRRPSISVPWILMSVKQRVVWLSCWITSTIRRRSAGHSPYNLGEHLKWCKTHSYYFHEKMKTKFNEISFYRKTQQEVTASIESCSWIKVGWGQHFSNHERLKGVSFIQVPSQSSVLNFNYTVHIKKEVLIHRNTKSAYWLISRLNH